MVFAIPDSNARNKYNSINQLQPPASSHQKLLNKLYCLHPLPPIKIYSTKSTVSTRFLSSNLRFNTLGKTYIKKETRGGEWFGIRPQPIMLFAT